MARFLLAAAVWVGLVVGPMRAQSDVGGGDAGGCKLHDHIYTCDGAAFQKALADAKTVGVETHNADGVARSQLTDLTKKLGKTIAAPGNPTDLILLMIPIAPEGVVDGPAQADLGTLRIYSATADGARGHLLWAETVTSDESLPWPVVVRRLILQFEAHFKIK